MLLLRVVRGPPPRKKKKKNAIHTHVTTLLYIHIMSLAIWLRHRQSRRWRVVNDVVSDFMIGLATVGEEWSLVVTSSSPRKLGEWSSRHCPTPTYLPTHLRPYRATRLLLDYGLSMVIESQFGLRASTNQQQQQQKTRNLHHCRQVVVVDDSATSPMLFMSSTTSSTTSLAIPATMGDVNDPLAKKHIVHVVHDVVTTTSSTTWLAILLRSLATLPSRWRRKHRRSCRSRRVVTTLLAILPCDHWRHYIPNR